MYRLFFPFDFIAIFSKKMQLIKGAYIFTARAVYKLINGRKYILHNYAACHVVASFISTEDL